MLRTFTLASALLFGLGTAHADWQYTTWNMTVVQALAASKGQLKPCTPQACKDQTSESTVAQLYGSYRSGEFSFTSFLNFNKADQKFANVTLKLINLEKAPQLGSALRSRYGEPASRSTSTGMNVSVWRDKNDEVLLMVIGLQGQTALTADVIYRPRITSSSRGL